MLRFDPGRAGLYVPGIEIVRPRGLSALYNSLVGYWKLDEASGDRADSIGSTTLTNINTVGSTAGIVYPLMANFLSSSSERLTAVTSATLNIGDIDFWAAGWGRLQTNVSGHLFGKWGGTTTNREWVLYYDNATTKMNFYVAYPTGQVASIAQSGTLATGTSYFFMCWHDSVNNTINLQVSNGTIASASHTGGVYGTSTVNFEVGAAAAAGFWNGRMGPIMLGKNYIPTADERTFLMNAGNGGRTLEAMKDY